MGAVFRSYSPSESLQSDRSASDRQRHRQKVRDAIRENIADVIAEQSIIGRSGDTIVKVPIRGIREYRFVYGDNNNGVAQGQGGEEPGQTVQQGDQPGEGEGGGGTADGTEYYETDVTIEEIVELMFDDLELPDMARKTMRMTLAQRRTKRKGYKRIGVRVHLDKKRTAKSRIRRRLAIERARRRPDDSEKPDPISTLEQPRFPYNQRDLRYRRRMPDIAEESNAVVLCLMDTSGSMDTMKKYLARSFFFMLYHFVRARYDTVDLVFVSHDTQAQEVGEEQFFSRGESGGTLISSGYDKLLEIIDARYHPSLWNVYAFHCSDGDNFPHDNVKAMRLAAELGEVCNLFGFGEIKPRGQRDWSGNSLRDKFTELEADNIKAVAITGKEDVWNAFRDFLGTEAEAAL